jgi:hypothetical protein
MPERAHRASQALDSSPGASSSSSSSSSSAAAARELILIDADHGANILPLLDDYAARGGVRGAGRLGAGAAAAASSSAAAPPNPIVVSVRILAFCGVAYNGAEPAAPHGQLHRAKGAGKNAAELLLAMTVGGLLATGRLAAYRRILLISSDAAVANVAAELVAALGGEGAAGAPLVAHVAAVKGEVERALDGGT